MMRVSIIGVLNVTPDSYYDGGRYDAVEVAVKRAGEMIEEGADIIEIGGESTGPGSEDVSIEEELKRVMPVLEALKMAYPEAQIAVDTYKGEVASQSLKTGVHMINDVTAGRSDPELFSAVAQSGAKLVLMYAKDPTPRTTVEEHQYDDVIAEISDFLEERKGTAEKAGVESANIIIDPGMGHFVSGDLRYSYEIIAGLERFKSLGCPLLLSPSRKSFLAGEDNLPPDERLPGTIAASAIAVLNGASYIRTHDVKEIRRACDVAALIR